MKILVEQLFEHYGFLVVGTVVGLCLIPFPVPMPKGHHTPFIGRVVMLQGTMAVQT